VSRGLEQLALTRGLPKQIVVDNGPEFAGKLLDAWAHQRGIELVFIRPEKPIENAYIESFNGRLRDECLNQHWFTSLGDAPRVIEGWRQDYNQIRPHSARGNKTLRAPLLRRSVGLADLLQFTDSRSIWTKVGGKVSRHCAFRT
jgi:putative transposase